MDGEGAGLEESDEYLRVVSKTFRTEEEGFQFYNEYAKVKGFSVRKEVDEIADYVNTFSEYDNMLQIDSLFLAKRHLLCLTNPYIEAQDRYLGDELLDAFIEHHRRSTPSDIREDGAVFIEKAVNTFALENDGKMNATVKLRMGGTRKGIDYLRNHMIFLPIRTEAPEHWFLVVVNTTIQFIQIINSIPHHLMDNDNIQTYLANTLRGMESHIRSALAQYGEGTCVWTHPDRNYNVASWPREVVGGIPQQSDGTSCGLFLIMNMLHWTGRELAQEFDQAIINRFRPKLAVILIKSPHNKLAKGHKKDAASK